MAIHIIVAIGVLAGLMLMFRVSPSELFDLYMKKRRGRPPTMKQIVDEANGVRHYNYFTRQFHETADILKVTGRADKYGFYCRISVLLMLAGGMTALLINNIPLVLPLSVTGMLLPLFTVKLTAATFKKQMNSETETALSIITGSYLRTDNIIMSVSENMQYIHDPLKGVFAEFLTQTQYINANVEQALAGMKRHVSNNVFKEWCDTMILCQKDHTMKNMLEPTVSKLSDMRVVQSELNALLYRPVRDFIMMVVLALMTIPILFFLNRAWFNNLIYTTIGKVSLTVLCLAVLFALSCMIKAVRPLEYRR